MAAMMIMGQPMKKAVTYVLMVGGTATITKFGADALSSRLFVQTADEMRTAPRTTADQKMFQLYRGLITVAVGLAGGKLMWKFSRPLAFGFAAGATVSGLDRIATTYDIKRQVKNLFLAQADQIPAPAADTVPAYGLMTMVPARQLGTQSYAGPMVQRTALNVAS